MKYDDDELEIDYSILEKIKNEKTDKKALSSLPITFDNELKGEFQGDLNFEKEIELEMQNFNNRFTHQEIKTIKVFENKIKSFKTIKVNFNDLNKEFVQPKFTKEVKTARSSSTIPVAEPKINLQVQEVKTSHSPNFKISDKFLSKNIDELLATKMHCYWSEHGTTRLFERVSKEKINIMKNEFENFLIDVFKNRSLNDFQPYEFHYRTSDVHTYRIVCAKKGNTIVITTLYRIDKQSKEEYQDKKNKYR